MIIEFWLIETYLCFDWHCLSLLCWQIHFLWRQDNIYNRKFNVCVFDIDSQNENRAKPLRSIVSSFTYEDHKVTIYLKLYCHLLPPSQHTELDITHQLGCRENKKNLELGVISWQNTRLRFLRTCIRTKNFLEISLIGQCFLERNIKRSEQN